MIEAIRKFLETTAGKATSTALVLLALVALAFAVKSTVSPPNPTAERWYMDSGTTPPTPFKAQLKPGIVVKGASGAPAYPAEDCYWTASGQPKSEPTHVLLNEAMGKDGPTFCPDCGRLVVGHNPTPYPGAKPPPTKDEVFAKAASNTQ